MKASVVPLVLGLCVMLSAASDAARPAHPVMATFRFLPRPEVEDMVLIGLSALAPDVRMADKIEATEGSELFTALHPGRLFDVRHDFNPDSYEERIAALTSPVPVLNEAGTDYLRHGKPADYPPMAADPVSRPSEGHTAQVTGSDGRVFGSASQICVERDIYAGLLERAGITHVNGTVSAAALEALPSRKPESSYWVVPTHVVADHADVDLITRTGRLIPAKVIARDGASDIAFLRAPRVDLPCGVLAPTLAFFGWTHNPNAALLSPRVTLDFDSNPGTRLSLPNEQTTWRQRSAVTFHKIGQLAGWEASSLIYVLARGVSGQSGSAILVPATADHVLLERQNRALRAMGRRERLMLGVFAAADPEHMILAAHSAPKILERLVAFFKERPALAPVDRVSLGYGTYYRELGFTHFRSSVGRMTTAGIESIGSGAANDTGSGAANDTGSGAANDTGSGGSPTAQSRLTPILKTLSGVNFAADQRLWLTFSKTDGGTEHWTEFEPLPEWALAQIRHGQPMHGIYQDQGQLYATSPRIQLPRYLPGDHENFFDIEYHQKLHNQRTNAGYPPCDTTVGLVNKLDRARQHWDWQELVPIVACEFPGEGMSEGPPRKHLFLAILGKPIVLMQAVILYDPDNAEAGPYRVLVGGDVRTLAIDSKPFWDRIHQYGAPAEAFAHVFVGLLGVSRPERRTVAVRGVGDVVVDVLDRQQLDHIGLRRFFTEDLSFFFTRNGGYRIAFEQGDDAFVINGPVTKFSVSRNVTADFANMRWLSRFDGRTVDKDFIIAERTRYYQKLRKRQQ